LTPTTEYALGFSAGSAAVMFVFERIFRLVRENKPANGNGRSGEKPTVFWESKFENLESHAERQTKILDKQTDILQDHSKMLIRLEERSKP
jgi:hypothetical protein